MKWLDYYLPEILGGIGAVIVIATTWLIEPLIAGYLTGLGLIGIAWMVTVTRRPPN